MHKHSIAEPDLHANPGSVEIWEHPDGLHVVVGKSAPRAKLTRTVRHDLIARHNVVDRTVDVVRITHDTLKAEDGYLSVWLRSRHLDTLPIRQGDGARETVIANGYTPTTTWHDSGPVRVAGIAHAA